MSMCVYVFFKQEKKDSRRKAVRKTVQQKKSLGY